MLHIRCWGSLLFLISVLSVATGQTSTGSGVFCVAIATADQNALLAGLNWACGPGGADCGPIQPGQPCYVANNVVQLASYAYNDYYHKNVATGATACSFNNTATITNTDPSTGSCIFAGSTQSSTGTGTNSTTNSTSGFTPAPTTSLFGPPPPPGMSGLFPNATSPGTDGTLGGLGAAVSLPVLYVPYILVVVLHLFYSYV